MMIMANMKSTLLFLVFISPSYCIIFFIIYCLSQGAAIWKDTCILPLSLLIIGNILAGFFLIKKQYWASFLMIVVGGFIISISTYFDFIFQILQLYGLYLIVHFSAVSLFVFHKNKEHKGRGR